MEVGEEKQVKGKVIPTNTYFPKTEALVSGYHNLDKNILQ